MARDGSVAVPFGLAQTSEATTIACPCGACGDIHFTVWRFIMVTGHRRTGSGTRKRGRGGPVNLPSTPGQPPSASESAFAHDKALANDSPPSPGARFILGADSGDTPEGSSVRFRIGTDGGQGQLQVLTAPDGGRLSRFLLNLLDDDDGDMLTDDHDQDPCCDVDDGCTGVREPQPRPKPVPSGTLAACVDPAEVALVH